MLESGMPVDISGDDGWTGWKNSWTVLMDAAMNNQTDVVRCLLEKGANVNKQDRSGRTALHFASGNNYTDVIKILLQHRARTDIKDNGGTTPIDLARKWNCKEALHLLQQH